MKEINSILKSHLEKTNEEIFLICKLDQSLNGRLYKINYKGNNAILKLYKSNDKLRFQREKNSLEILNKNEFKFCPKLFYFDDLPIVIEKLPSNINGFLYDPLDKYSGDNLNKISDWKIICDYLFSL